MTKRIQHFFEALGFRLICRIYTSLPARQASGLGGWIARSVGPLFPVTRVAEKNLQMIFPRLSKPELRRIIKGMWDHWGRVSAEYCHIPYFLNTPQCLTIQGAEVIEQLKQDQKPAILFTGHLGNFQMITLAAARHGLPLVQFYRQASNPQVDAGMRQLQQQAAKKILTKGESGLKGMIRALKEGEHLFILVDQKAHGGLTVPFLGKPALTASSIARLAQHFDCPLVPVRAKRGPHPLHFEITFYPPLSLQQRSEADIMTEVNALLSQWIRETPEQWFWVHKRWPFSSL